MIEEHYQYAKSYRSGENLSAETFQKSSRVQTEGYEIPNVINIFLVYALLIYKYRCEEMVADRLSIPYHIQNKSKDMKQRSRFTFRD